MQTISFPTYIPPARPVVLLVDSAEVHIDLHTFELANKNGVYFYALLKNATHLVQPADVGMFGPMKQAWYKNVRRFTQRNPNTDITKRNFCSVFRSCWEDVMRPSILCSSFSKSGIYPLARQQITEDQIGPSLVYTTCSSTATGPESLSTPLTRENASVSCSRQSASFDTGPTPLARESTSLSPFDQSTSLDTAPFPLSVESASFILLSLSDQSASFDARSNPVAKESASLSLSDQSASIDAGSLSKDNPLFPVSDRSAPSTLSNHSPKPPSLDSGSMATAKSALKAVESVIRTPVREKYKRRIEEGYDLEGSPTYEAWKVLHQAVVPSQNFPEAEQLNPSMTPCAIATKDTELPDQCISSDRTPAASSEVSPFLLEITTYPVAVEGKTSRPKSTKKNLPNFLNSEHSMGILREEKLKKARELAAKQNKLREREEKREAKRKETEEKKRKMEERKRNREAAKVSQKRKRVQAKDKGKQWRTELSRAHENDGNACKMCLVEYDPTDNGNLRWVMCDLCRMWMHIDCVPIGVDTTPIDNNEKFFCHDCS